MRVITGIARGRKLKTLDGIDVRPTAEAIKEAVFSVIQFDLEGRIVLDLFAGSGQLGIEALSRGAARAVFVDKNPAAIETIKENLNACGLFQVSQAVCADFSSFLKTNREQFDLVFIDPPYLSGAVQAILPEIAEQLREGGTVICETGTDIVLPEQIGRLVQQKQRRYGRTMITYYRLTPNQFS